MPQINILKHLLLSLTAIIGATAAEQAPNIIFIYADDMGWTGTSVEMIKGDSSSKSDFYQTPNLEKLAAKGMVFSRAYSPGPLCTPSRAAALTGRTPAELHITSPGGKSDSSRKMLTPRTSTQLSQTLPTIGKTLKGAGYATALLGKWHIGRKGHAGDYGFDLHDGSTQNDSKGTDEDPKSIFSLTTRGIEFMEKNAAAKKPFYLQISHYAVHAPTQSRPSSIQKFQSSSVGHNHNLPDYAGMTWDLDQSLDKIIQAIEKLGITHNTYIVFMSDNGAQGNARRPSNAPLSRGKGTLYEGGIRVPLIITGPKVKAAYCSTPVSGTDLFATFSSWALTDTQLIESEDLTPLLTDQETNFNRRKTLFFHYPHYGKGMQTPQTALISNHWKLIKNWDTGTTELFNLKDDISESTDLSLKQPQIFKRMHKEMADRLKETAAQIPTKNSNYDPSNPPARRSKRSRK